MRLFNRLFTIVCIVALCLAVLPVASASEWNRKTIVTFSGPVEVPGVGAQVLPAGTYVFKIMDSLSDRHIVQIFNEREDHLYTTILAIPNFRLQSTDKTVMTFKERAEGQPQAIRAWFYPGRQWGEEFVYPKAKALELARVSNEPVLYAEASSIEDLRTVPVEAVKPTGEPVAIAEVVQPPPMETAEALPHTASYLPLLALLGLLSMGASGLIRKYSA
ncbi:MAG TPA: hypothetical protein VLA96_08635 [Terriglobales bacterium]|nr:hypothetical protein [Terriglobales bacterium]